MKTRKNHIAFDEAIGIENQQPLTAQEQDEIREYRRSLYEKRSAEDRLNDILVGFRFTLRNYVASEHPKQIILLGEFLYAMISRIGIKKSWFAEYIGISPKNINKYFSGERKFTADHALKLEKMFDIRAEVLLEIQLKNELLEVKKSREHDYEKYTLKGLLAG